MNQVQLAGFEARCVSTIDHLDGNPLPLDRVASITEILFRRQNYANQPQPTHCAVEDRFRWSAVGFSGRYDGN